MLVGSAVETTERPATDEVRPRTAARLFVRMWAVAHLIHVAGFTDSRLDTLWNVGLAATALLVIRFPDRALWLVLMAVLQLVDYAVEMPFSPDHWALLSFVNLVLLVTMVVRRACDLGSVEAAFPAARLVLLVAYGFAAVSKYNTSFLDPVMSCATAIAGAASYGLSRELGPAGLPGIATLACETAIPVLLAIPVTRRHGVRLALAFHFLLSASPAFAVVDFTAALYALFFLFLPEGEATALVGRMEAVARRSAIVRDVRRWPWAATAVALAGLGFAGYLQPRVGSGLLLLASEVYLGGLLVAGLVGWRGRWPARAFGRVALVYVPIVLLVAAWGASPYVGLRTTGVFTMFSGLRTEGPAPNHLFLPTVRLVDWQDDFVVIEESNDPALATAHGGVVGVPLIALRRIATERPALEVHGRRDGRPVVYGPGPGQIPLEPLPAWQAKLMLFRPVAVASTPFCSVS